MENSVKITGIIVLGIVFLALLGTYVIFQVSPVSGNTINAEGVSQIKAVPDLVTIYFNVETKGTTSADATQKNSEIVDNLITNLVKLGLERKEIVTQNFNVYPDYSWVNGQRKEEGYRATHSIKVEISTDRTDKIGQIIDAGVNAGAIISYINFELSVEKQNEYKALALKQATEDARNKAEAIADGLGKTLGKVVSVSTSDFGYNPWRLYGNDAMATGGAEAKIATTSIQPGEQDINARVVVVYKL